MTAVTVVKRIEDLSQTRESVLVTATDGYTLEARKLGTVDAVSVSLMEDAGALSIPLSVALSGRTATIHCTGLSAKQVLVEFLGRL